MTWHCRTMRADKTWAAGGLVLTLLTAGCGMPDPSGEPASSAADPAAVSAARSPEDSGTGRPTGGQARSSRTGKLTHAAATGSESPQAGGQVKNVSSLDIVEFASPSGRILCGMGEDSVDCTPPTELLESDKVPPASQVCPGEEIAVAAVTLGRSGTGKWMCRGDVSAWPTPGSESTSWATGGFGATSDDGEYSALPYGKSLKRGDFTCASAENGVTCTNSSGGGFRVNRSAATFF